MTELKDLNKNALEFKTSYYFKESWRIFKLESKNFLTFTVLLLFICTSCAFIPVIGQGIIGLVLSLFSAGYIYVTTKILKNEKIDLGDFFTPLSQWYPILVSAFIGGLLTIVGFLLGILPGIYLEIAYLFSVQIILIENLSPWQSLETSRKLINKVFFTFTAFSFLNLMLVVSGLLLLGIGIIVTFPLFYIAFTVCFLDLKQQINDSNSTK